ncbi:GNAT family N-acetyltransferase [Halomonas sp. McH1-25]|uniref:GNAT family N-acetyltransferase n=1 Tax=unclassified Halomonas TaxID=2609666 RepID=UPI001EF4C076|nr:MULTISPECIES: GNAT family N-acetyltransferase [unclassified Halomonas]MCG7600957.1 GNAT family N-acetyltransferase [Halomonas sp. McH1-25]MCP1341545.1 GNAT family N-acetyltransferase [Halomonas sp. FL8]MCP1359769.1 GNAT family N-acetyltransferase [Halomonas sp. BBD45]
MTRDSDLRVIHGDWQTLGQAAAELRRRVFVEEQHVSEEEEWDGQDPVCLHFLAYLAGQPVGTARLLPDGHIGRVAVLAQARGRGIGLALMHGAIEAARLQGHDEVILAAQLHALPFYERLGFRAYDQEFLDAGIPHRNMRLTLSA